MIKSENHRKVYVVVPESKVYDGFRSHPSQEGYFNYEDAKNYVLSCSDKPKMIRPFLFESDETVYYIYEIICV